MSSLESSCGVFTVCSFYWPEFPAGNKMLFLVEKLNYFVRIVLVGAVFLTAAAFLWQLMRKWMKKSGHIHFLYGFMLFSGAGAMILFLSGIVCMCLPQDVFHDRWTLFFSGWYVMSGISTTILNMTLTGIWFVGFLKSGSRIAENNKGYRYLFQLNQPVSDPEMLERFERAARKNGLKKIPLLFVNEAVRIPVLEGILSPAVVIPAENFSPEEQMLMFAHELTHLKHCHLLFRYGVYAIFMVYWFVPLESVWMEELVELQESLCDIAVCSNYGTYFSASRYFNMILSISGGMKNFCPERRSYQIPGLAGNVSQLQRRIGNMSGYYFGVRKNAAIPALAVGCSLLLLLVAATGAIVPDVLFLQDVRVDNAWKNDINNEMLLEKSGGIENQREGSILQKNTLTQYTLEPGAELVSDVFSAAEGEKFALIIMSSVGGYEIGLKGQKNFVIIPDAQENVSLNLELTDREYSLYIFNNGNEKIEMEIYCTW